MAEEKSFLDGKTIAIAVLAIAAAGLLYLNYGGVSGKMSGDEAAKAALGFINTQMLQGQAPAILDGDTTEEHGVYKINIKVGENSFPSYITKDGKLLFPQVIEVKESTSTADSNTPAEQVVKSDRPSVKLFVMSYCPYGLQAEKGFLGAYNGLKDVADMGIYFVDYAMHGEKEVNENLRQYCIAKDENVKFAEYLSCFVDKGEAEACLATAAIDKAKLSACETATDEQFSISKNLADETTWSGGQFPPFNVYKDLNIQYGVQGSPTLVINDKVVSVGRSPEEMKKAICDAFNVAPEACLNELSTTTPSAGFGWGAGTSGGDASCGQ